ncbi:MAG: tetratricopeptide repeat protein [Deltaproteobacteria bacterium]|nr:tetratricopeptide repeat protein [Deltaproteobacteria bacterium]
MGKSKVPKQPESAQMSQQTEPPQQDFPAELKEQVAAALAAEGESVDKGIDAWKKIVQAAPEAWAPRRELARVYKQAERWKNYVDILSEGVDKASWSSDADKVPLLWEMVEVYRDRLKLNQKVISSFTQLLTIAPDNLEAVDALAEQYEAMNRWPDVISLLRKKVEVVATVPEKIALHLRIANLYIEKFSNQAEAIKAFEAVLDLDSSNASALDYLKQMYEKRRDWDKLLKIQLAEIERLTNPSERAARLLEVAKLASERLKRAPVSIDLWERVLAESPASAEALTELEKLYEREKNYDRLAAVLEQRVAVGAIDADPVVVLVKLATLYNDRLENNSKAIETWQKLLTIDPENRRAQDAVKKLYVTLKDWDALEKFYAGQNRWDEFVRVLERQADTEEGEGRVSLALKIGSLYRDRLERADRATRAFEKALEADANNLAAAEALVPLYEQSNDAAKLAGVLKVVLAHTKDPAERQERMLKIVELLDGPGRDKPGAADMALRAFAEAPEQAWPRQWAERLAAEVGNWEALAAAYEQGLNSVKGEAKLGLLRTLARVYERELMDAETAIACNRRVLEASADDAEAVDALQRLFIATERYEDLLAIYDKKLAMATTDDERRDVRFKLASLYEEEVKDADKAIEAYSAILKEAPEETAALQALDRLYSATSNWKELAKTLERELALALDEVASADLIYRLGKIKEDHLGNPEGAVEAYTRALGLYPAHEEARHALEAHLAKSPHQMAAVAALEPIYEQLQDLPRLVEVQRIKLANEKDKQARVNLLLRVGALEAALEHNVPAFEAYAAAFKESPASGKARAALQDLAATLERWDGLAALYEEALTAGGLEPSLERELLTVLAEVYDTRLGRSDKAVACLQRAQEIAPEDASALDSLVNLYTRTERWPELVETLKRKAELVTDGEVRQEIYERIATIAEEMTGNNADAIAAWKEVLSENASSVRALRALDRLYAHEGLDTELADNLQRQLELTADPEDVVTLLSRLGLLREQRLGQVAAAVETYRRLLEIEPEHAATITALERILPNPAHEQALAELLEPVYRARGDFASLIRVIEIQIKHIEEPQRRLQRLHEIATCYEDGLDDPVRAYEALARGLVEDALDAETHRRIERLARVLGRFEDLIERYRTIVKSVAEPELKRALFHKIAQLASQEVGRDDVAAEAYLQAIEVAPNDLEAADALQAIYTRSGDYKQLVSLYRKKMDMVSDPGVRKDLGFKAAQIYEEILETPDEAIGAFKQILATDDADRAALENLERLYVRLGRWSDLKDVYSRKAELAQDPAERKRSLYVLGQVYDRELADPARAIETYSSVLDIDPNDMEALQALDRLYAQTERWYDLLAILERQTELSPSSAEVVSLRFRVGDLWREKLGDLARACEAYGQVLSIDPTHEQTLAALEDMMARGQEPITAARVLEPIYEVASDWDKVVRVYEVMVAHTADAATKLELLWQIAQIQERRLGNFDDAFGAYGRALAVDPTNNDTIAHLDRLAQVTGRWADMAQLLESQLGKIEDARLQVELLLRVARIYEGETREDDKAIAAYKRVADIEPERREGLDALDRLYTKASRWEELAEVLRKEVRLAGSEEEIISFTFRLAQVLELALGDVAGAVDCYQDILNADPAHPETRASLENLLRAGTMQAEIAQILEPLYRLGEEWEKLVDLYQTELTRLTDKEERVNLVRRLADIAENKLYDQVGAFEWWCRLVLEDPSSEAAYEDLVRLAKATHQWELYVGTLTEAAQQATDPVIKRTALLRLASTYEHELRNLASAEQVLQVVLQTNAQDPQALESLDRIYNAQGQHEKLADVLRRRIAVTDDGRDLVQLNLRLGRVVGEVLGDTEAAIRAYDQVLEAESRSPEALEALERLFLRAERWQDLFGVYEKMVDIARGDAALSDCYARMATLTAQVFDDREKAIDLWKRVLDLRGPDLVALTNLADLYEVAGEWRELTDILDSQIRVTDDPNVKIPLYKRLGRIWGEQLSRERNALECWLAVLELDPSDVEALKALAVNYRATGAWEELADALRRLIYLGPGVLPSEELKELYAQLGELEGQTLMRTDAAIEAWREVLNLDPEDFRAMAALEGLFTQEARWEECVEILERRANALTDHADKVDVMMQAASIWADKIGNTAQAAGVYERLMEIDPNNQVASVELEQIYRQQENWEPLIGLLVGRAEDVNAAPRQRQESLCAVAEIYERQLGDADNAFTVLGAAFEIDFSNDHVAAELERLATQAGKWNELVGQWTQVAQAEQDPKVAADLWVKIARWGDSALQNTDYAIQTATYALQLDANNAGAMQALSDFYRKKQMWPDLVAILARHADVEEDQDKRVATLLSLAETYENQMGDVASATDAYERALSADPRSMAAIDALERLYRRTSAWDRLVDVLAKKSHSVDDSDESIRLSLQVGQIWEERLGDDRRAIDAYKEVLIADARNTNALDALERLYGKTNQLEAQMDIVEQKLEVADVGADRIRLLQRQAKMWEETFRKPDRAIESLQTALMQDEGFIQAYRDLERLYRVEKRWEDLVENYRRHILVTNDPAERTALYYQMGLVYEKEIKDYDRAIEAYDDVVSFQPDHVEALSALSRLYELTENWDRAVDVMTRIAGSVEGPQRVELNYRLGKIYDEQMRMPDQAEQWLSEALALDPGHLPSMMALLNLYKSRGDSLKAATLMERAEGQTRNTLEKTRLLYDAGRLYLDDLGDEDRAMAMFARVVELDPEHAEAGEPLAELYFQREQWAPLVPVLEMLARKKDRKSARELHPTYFRLAKACAALGLDEKALKYYKQAFDLDSTHLPTLMGRADLLYRKEQWDDAFKLYQTILVHHREAQGDDQIVEIFYRIGRIKLKVGEKPKAINMFEKALEVQPGHKPTLEALSEIYAAAGDWEAVIKQKRVLLANARTDEERMELLQQIIDIYLGKVNDKQKAIAAYLEMLDIEPSSMSLLHKVLALFSETRQWKKAVETALRLAEVDTDKIRRAKYFEAAGNFTNSELNSPDEAIEFYNQALDENPDDLKVFERIDKILTKKKDWKNQERAYRRMIKRLGTDVPEDKRPTQVALWRGLGEIYRSRLKDLNAAIQTFEVCVGLEPGNFKTREILAELYSVSGPEHAEKASREYRVLINKAPDLPQMVPYIHLLWNSFKETNNYDRAWCVAHVLTFLRQANEEQARFYEQYKIKGMQKTRLRLTEEMWRRFVFHKDEDWFLSQIMATISEAVVQHTLVDMKTTGVRRKDARDITSDPLLFSKIFSSVTLALNVPPPAVFLREENPGDMAFYSLFDKQGPLPAVVVGNALLQGRTEKDLAYLLGRKVALLRADHLVRWPTMVEQVAQLKAFVIAAIKRVQPNIPVPPDMAPALPSYMAILERMSGRSLEHLAAVVNQLMQFKGDLNTNKWVKGVDFTATRAGFLMCSDLEVASRLIQAEPMTVGMADPREKIRDLIEWAISDEYFTLRQQVGISIGS